MFMKYLAALLLLIATSAFGQPDPQDGSPTFTVTDVPQGRPLRVIVYGDMRFTDPRNTSDTQPGVRAWLAQKVGEEKPDVLLLTGDMPYHGSDEADWRVYQHETALWTQERLRLYPTIGNHEGLPDPRSGMRNYFAAYPQLQSHPWYSVQIGNLYLITLDSSEFLSKGWEQRLWLESQLDHLPASIDFVFFLFHRPLISDLQTAFMLGIPDLTTIELRHYLESKAAVSRAKFAVFNGHIHNYERFYKNGIMHVITGGGGARPYPVFIRGEEDLYRAGTYPNFNYVLLTINGKHADAKMFRVVDPAAPQKTLELKDTFQLDGK